MSVVRNIHKDVGHLRRFDLYDADENPIDLGTVTHLAVEYYRGSYPNRRLYRRLTIGDGITVIDTANGIIDVTLDLDFTSIADTFSGFFQFNGPDGRLYRKEAPIYRVS